MVQTREPSSPRKITASVSMTEEMKQAITEQAEKEGHRNFSEIVVKAVQDYLLARLFGKKVA